MPNALSLPRRLLARKIKPHRTIYYPDFDVALGADPDHSITEERYVTFGVSERGRLLVVAHTDEEETIRIINARIASKGERELYEEG